MKKDEDAMKYRLLKHIAVSKILMLRYQKELYNLQEDIDDENEEEIKYLTEITKEINYIVGVIKLNEMHLKNILISIRENEEYLESHHQEILQILKRIAEFNKKIKLN